MPASRSTSWAGLQRSPAHAKDAVHATSTPRTCSWPGTARFTSPTLPGARLSFPARAQLRREPDVFAASVMLAELLGGQQSASWGASPRARCGARRGPRRARGAEVRRRTAAGTTLAQRGDHGAGPSREHRGRARTSHPRDGPGGRASGARERDPVARFVARRAPFFVVHAGLCHRGAGARARLQRPRGEIAGRARKIGQIVKQQMLVRKRSASSSAPPAR